MKIARVIAPLAVLAFGCGQQQLPAVSEIPPCNLSVLDSVEWSWVIRHISSAGSWASSSCRVVVLPFWTGPRATSGSSRTWGNTPRRLAAGALGPGEIVQPYGLLLWSNGDLGVIDPFQGGLLRFSPDGEYLGIVFEATHNIPFDPRMVGDTAYIAQRTAIETEGDQTFMETYPRILPHEP
ncbi:MAG: hypothetical protein MZV63_34575 [Marinilabiliales bacterium]|nr:hypothetical protein [Marinilabiliales bacterium]